MLRSRAHARQRPSEPSDERSGSGYYSGYPDYPAHYHQQQQQHSAGGYGHYGQQLSQQPFDKKEGSGSSRHAKKKSICSSFLWHSFLFIVLLILCVDAYAQYRHYNNASKKLAAVSRHLTDHHEQEDAIDGEEAALDQQTNFESDPQKTAREITARLHSLSQLQAQLTSALQEYISHSIPKLNAEISSLQHQIEVIEKEVSAKNTELFHLRQERVNQEGQLQTLKNSFNEAHKSENGKLLLPQKQAGGRDVKVEVDVDITTAEELDAYVKSREDVLWRKIDGLIGRLKDQSRIEVIEWFGKGPHKVEFEIEYPQYTQDIDDPTQWPRVRGILLIELAPLNLMPVALNMFLQQVHHKLWNGCAFVINAAHILQAGPHKYNNERYVPNHSDLMGKFTAAKLNKIPFQEYHQDYPHEQWTVGMAGRPGGPDFYINKVNNTKNHGPGGQLIHDLHEEADPCFGKIVRGFEIMNEINKIPVDYNSGSSLKHHVLIVEARVVTEEHNPLTEEHEHTLDDDYHRDHLQDEEYHEEEQEHPHEDEREHPHEEHAQAEVQHAQQEDHRQGPGPSPI